MPLVPISVVTDDYDRVRALASGEVGVEGCEVTYFHLPPSSSFARMMRYAEWDVSEMSLSTYMLARSRGDFPYRAMPVILSRVFAHSSIWIHAEGPIKRPEDLKGRTIGLPNYHFTRGLCVKGMLSDEHGVAPFDMHWRLGGVDQPFDHAYMGFTPPEGLDIEPIGAGETLTELLLAGRIDAIVAARDPQAFTDGNAPIVRLFPDFRSAERAYFQKTGVFPIMHVLGVKDDLLARHPWLALNLMQAFETAKALCLPRLRELDALTVTLPWLVAEAEDTIKLMGEDYWPYGVEKNRPTLEAQTRWSHEQGISPKRLAVEDLFVPTTLDWRAVDAGRR